MKRVYKYPLRVNDRQIVKLPKGAEILSVQIQRGDICLWALIDTSVKETNDVAIRIHGTGHDIEYDGNLRFIGTVQILLGDIVFYVFEEIKEQQQQTVQPVQQTAPQSAPAYQQFPPQVDANGNPKDDLPF